MKFANSFLGAIIITGATMFSSCSEEPSKKDNNVLAKFHGRDDVEISPGKFIAIGNTSKDIDYKPKGFKEAIGLAVDNIKNGTEWTHIGIPWNGKLIEWKGEPIPVCLREYENNLYMIAYDRTVPNKSKFRFYMDDGNTLVEIKASDFPKKIASQNMWWTCNIYGRIGDRFADHLQATIDLDPQNIGFSGTTTADIWLCLITGKEYYEISGYSSTLDYDNRIKLLEEYAEKNKPIKLTMILKKRPPLPEWYIKLNKEDPNKFPIPNYFDTPVPLPAPDDKAK
ncbi:MAG TPA: hypothetical protein DET40_02380 [Lentisphaeria bacterium]|nr:MAG: hypothetical protein A2X45_20525 [Lentisphaerae bacterium GWF2_50_93]HCE42379.1 hypothetical protein [Lentisphaeria bacterium]